MLGKGLELLIVNSGILEINQLLFSDDTALVADSEEKLCRLEVVYTLSGRTGSALAWRSEGRMFASQSVQ